MVKIIKIFALIGFMTLAVPQVFSGTAEKVQISVGEAVIIEVDRPEKIAVGDSAIADVKTISEKEILLSGRTAGTTILIIWDRPDRKRTIQVIVISAEMEKAMIEVDVQVLEIRKNSLSDLGLNWAESVKALRIGEEKIPALFQVGNFERLEKIQTTLNVMVTNGNARFLAKPRLLTVSGGQAKFQSGGEIPVIYQDKDRMSTEWKPYGVKLEVNPTADSLGNINAGIKAEVSSIDAASGVNINNFVLPGIKTSWVDTTIHVKKGGTIIIAGMIKNETTSQSQGLPILSDLPLIGELFKRYHTENLDLELVIFVTLSLVGK